MTETKLPDAPAAAPSGRDHKDADQLLKALEAMEGHANAVSEKLSSFDKPYAMLSGKDLAHLREGLKRIAERVEVSKALVEKIVVEPEKEPEAPVEAEAAPKIVLTPEDYMFPSDDLSDHITGLPSRVIGGKAFESALSEGRPRYVALFALDRIYHIANRYGVDVANQAIRHCASFLKQKMPSDALLFRWRGSAFVILFDISGVMGDAKLLMEQMSIQKLKFNFMTNHRSAMVILTLSFLTISLADHESADPVIRIVDQFIENHSARQPH